LSGDGRAVLVKKAMRGYEFLFKGYSTPLFRERWSLAIGHNRLATHGDVVDDNAHPFRLRAPSGMVYACHNGIVRRTEELVARFKVPTHSVDSHMALDAIARNAGSTEDSLVESITAVTAAIRASGSAFSFLYLDPKKRAVYAWRSPTRELELIDAGAGDLGAWACSEWNIFSGAWGLNRGMLGSLDKIRHFAAEPYVLYKLAHGKIRTMLRIGPPEKSDERSALRFWERKTDSLKTIERSLFGLSGADHVDRE
jgi:hypothetical protein